MTTYKSTFLKSKTKSEKYVQELLDQINGALRELKASGELDAIKAKYIAQ